MAHSCTLDNLSYITNLPLHQYHVGSDVEQMIGKLIIKIDIKLSQRDVLYVKNLIKDQN